MNIYLIVSKDSEAFFFSKIKSTGYTVNMLPVGLIKFYQQPVLYDNTAKSAV